MTARAGLFIAAIAAGVVLAAAALVACDHDARQEAAQLVEAVDRFRKADNPGKPATLATLRAVPCSAPDVCRARDACLASAEATSKALRLKSEVEQGLAAVESGALARESDAARALPGKLDEAESLLKEGFGALPACDDQIMAIKRRHRL